MGWAGEAAPRRTAALAKLLRVLAVIVAGGAAVILLIPLFVEYVFMGRSPVVEVNGEGFSTSIYAQTRDFRRFEIIRELNQLAKYRDEARRESSHGVEEIEVSLERLRSTLSTADFQAVEDLIDTQLVSRKAEVEGISISDDELEAEIESVLAPPPRPGPAAEVTRITPSDSARSTADARPFEARLKEFLGRLDLDRRLFERLMRTRILDRKFVAAAEAAVAEVQEQVHVRRLLAPTEETAAAILKRFGSGERWEAIALQDSYPSSDQTEGEDLGYLPRGILEKPIEDAAFAQEAGKIAGPVAMPDGQHLLFIVEKATARKLSPEHLRQLREKAAGDYRRAFRETAAIQYHLNSDKLAWAQRHGLKNVGALEEAVFEGSPLP